MRTELIRNSQPCMTDIYIHIDARMAVQMGLQSRKDEARAVSAHAAYEHVHHVHELTVGE
eukprot:COSAG05_NODE_4325_length_1567_cov_1.333106_1_plen_59_part_10